MRVLNLYAGIGGNRKSWEGHEVTAVELNPDIARVYQDLFPEDTVVVGDAHQFLLENYQNYDFIWSSPPCPSHSKARYGLGFHGGKVDAVYPDMRLYEEILLLKHHFKGKYVVENVMAYYKPLIQPIQLGRHWFWTNFPVSDMKLPPSRVSQQSTKYSKSPLKLYNVSDYEKRLGYDLDGYKIANKRLLLRNCVEPELGAHILDHAMRPHPQYELFNAQCLKN